MQDSFEHIEIISEKLKKVIEELVKSSNENSMEELTDSLKGIDNDLIEVNEKLVIENMNFTFYLIDQIKMNIDLLEEYNHIKEKYPDALKSIQGIRTGEKIKVYFTGGFSAGKTTFIERILAKTVGVKSSFPQTSSLITHMSGSRSTVEVLFFNTIEIADEKSGDFRRLLKNYAIDHYFYQKNNVWESHTKDPILLPNLTGANLINFIRKFQDFPGSISSIKIIHKESKRKKSILEFVELNDLPGFGGKQVHDSYLESSLDKSKMNIILYLIDTDKGIPSEDEYDSLINFLKNLSNTENLMFAWIFQKKSNQNDENINWVEEKRKDINNSLKIEIDKRKDSKLNKVFDIFSKSLVFDARGSKQESVMANQIFSKIIAQYMITYTQKYIKIVNNNLINKIKLPQILFNNEFDVQNPVKLSIERLKKLSNKNSISQEDFKSELRNIFGRKYIEKNLQYNDKNFNNTSQVMLSEIDSIIQEIILKANLKNDVRPTIFKKIFPDEKRQEFEIDFNFLKINFSKEIENNKDWSQYLIIAQGFVLLNAYYEKKLASFYLSDLASSIINNLKYNIKRLDKNINY